MELINFDTHFEKYTDTWLKKNAGKHKNADALEAAMFEVYMRWVNTPADWLGGKTPDSYFESFTDPDELVDMLAEYHRRGIPMPEQLTERIAHLGASAAAPLMRFAFETREPAAAGIVALNLLKDIGAENSIDACIALIMEGDAPADMADVAAELIAEAGAVVVPRLLDKMGEASSGARAIFLDILCNFPGDERIYNYAVEAFRSQFDHRALYASYLGKLGDVRAIEPLAAALDLADITYLDYIEIAGAIEALGGDVGSTRDFTGDPYYESLKSMK